MIKTLVLSISVFMSITSFALADTFGSGDNAFNIDFVTIGNPGNLGDTRTEMDEYGMPKASPLACGAVDSECRIGMYEISNAQWSSFIAEVGVPTGDDGGYSKKVYWTSGQQPVNNVSWYEAAQFCNYLTSGDKSKGVYQFNGNNANPGIFLGIDRQIAKITYGMIYFLPTQDEWYKAAYYTGSGYSLFPNGTDVISIAGIDSNYAQNNPYSGPWEVTMGMMEQNGTYNMTGNIHEWTETQVDNYRALRGGGFSIAARFQGSSYWTVSYSFDESSNYGFRVASIPEPCTLLLLGLGGLLIRKR
jgi:formylglycine-generating enzyme required for sulfatase activity